MDVYLDEQLLPPAAGAETVGDLLARLRRDDPDRLVVAIHLNGREIIGQGIDSLRQTPLNAPGRLEMQSSSARSLAAAALGQAAETLEQSRCCHTRVAELIAAGKSAKAMDELNECFTAWNAVEQSLRQSAGLTGIDLDAPAAGGEPPARRIAELRDCLASIGEGLKARDHVAVADLIEYDMAEVTDAWQQMLLGLQDALLAEAE